MPDPVDSWIEDGTAEAEPVTTETPEPEAPEAPEPVETAPEPTPAGEQPRDESGRFASPEEWAAAGDEPVETPAEPAPPPAEPEVPPEGASAQEIADFIAAQRGDEEFKIPKDVRIPLKVQGETVYEPLDEVLKRGMMEADYRKKTSEVARRRDALTELESRIEADRAKVQAREQYLKEQEEELRAAQTDPEKYAAYEEHLRAYKNNPYYRKNVDAALEQRETDAELQAYKQAEDRRIVQTGVQQAQQWIEEHAQEFPNVDAERVRRVYGQRLATGSASLDPRAVRAVFQEEADYLAQSVSPLQQELAELRSQIEAIQASKDAEKQNETTAHAVERAKSPKVATGGAPPGAPKKPEPKPFGIKELPSRIGEWSRQRD